MATIEVPTTVMVGTPRRPDRAEESGSDCGNRSRGAAVTLQNRGHMLPLEDPDAVTDEIVRAVKG